MRYIKRASNIFEKIVSNDNLKEAVANVNKSHRWNSFGVPNKTVLWVDATFDERVDELKQIIIDGFIPHPTKKKRRYDNNAKKWRDIEEPKLYPDQYVHHALIQVLEPIMMRGMDYYCCGSVKGRGTIYGVKYIQKWMNTDKKGTRWCAELDIHHFYEQLSVNVVMNRMKQLIKDHKALDLIERVLLNDLTIGAYFSQWFANTTLQPLDHMIRESGIKINHYIRYMDNITLFSNRKRDIIKMIAIIEKWLNEHGLRLNNKKQYFRTDVRLPNALGYRYGRGYILIRKSRLLNIKRQLNIYYKKKASGQPISPKFAQSLLARLSGLKYCNCCNIKKNIIEKGVVKDLKNVVRVYYKRRYIEWNIFLEQYKKIMNFAKS